MGDPLDAAQLLPSTPELLLSLASVAILLGATFAVSRDLRRRGYAAWWVAGAHTLFMPPLGLVGWAVLRFSSRAPDHPVEHRPS